VRQTFFVPVRGTRAGPLALRTGRLLSGECVGLAFTSPAALRATLGPSQQFAELDSRALHDLLAPLGVARLRVDPHPVAELGTAA